MPVNQHLMDSLTKRYGEERGRSVYFAMEAAGSGPFAEGNALHADHLVFAAAHNLPPIRRHSTPKVVSHRAASAPVRHKAPAPMHKMRGSSASKR